MKIESAFYKKEQTTAFAVASLFERNKLLENTNIVQRVLALNNGTFDENHETLKNYKNLLNVRQSIALDNSLVINKDAFSNSYDEDGNLISNNTALSYLSEEEAYMMNKTQEIANQEILRLYIDSYMAPLISDMKWRLGAVTDVLMAPKNSTVSKYKYYLYNDSNFVFPNISAATYGIIDGDKLKVESCISPKDAQKLTIDDLYVLKQYGYLVKTTKIAIAGSNQIIRAGELTNGKLFDEVIDEIDTVPVFPEIIPLLDNSYKAYDVNTLYGMYTRSSFSMKVPTKILSRGNVIQTNEYFASMMFPPYKDGSNKSILDKTNTVADEYFSSKLAYNIDTFTLYNNKSTDSIDSNSGLPIEKPTGFTYRDPGFKSITDNINFWQHMLDKSFGIVSTYLSEWDLSLYMQENMLTKDSMNAAQKIWLNYRIRQDNPLAHDTLDSSYRTDKALSFNVVGSSVSKIESDCLKPWRPSDFPLSIYWTPYLERRHYYKHDWFGYTGNKLKWNTYENTITSNIDGDYDIEYLPIPEYISPFDGDTSFNHNSYVPYGTFYNEPIKEYSYVGKKTKDNLKHDDLVRMGLSSWKNANAMYFQAFYYTESDGLGDQDIIASNLLNTALGLNKGEPSALGKDVTALRDSMKEDFINSGGNNGYQGANAGTSGQKIANKLKKFVLPGKYGGGGGFSEPDTSSINPNQTFGQSISLSDTPFSDSLAKPDASSMGNYTGLNRFSPALYGGPHGKYYSPNTIQGFFEPKNIFLRDTPRISANDANDFTSNNHYSLYEGNNKYYSNISSDDTYYENIKEGASFTDNLRKIKNGITNWTLGYVTTHERWDGTIRGTVLRNGYYNRCISYSFPSTRNGNNLTYYGNMVFSSEVSYQYVGHWGNFWNYYWNWAYYSYYNDFATRKLVWMSNAWYYEVTTLGVCRLAYHYQWVTKTYKKYILHDEPDVRWKISSQKISSYSVASTYSSPYWSFIRQLIQWAWWLNPTANQNYDEAYHSGNLHWWNWPIYTYKRSRNIKARYPVYIRQKVAFVLTVPDDASERKIKDYMLFSTINGNQSNKLIFLEGNEANRYSQGPASLFQANVNINWYLCTNWIPETQWYQYHGHTGWWFWTRCYYYLTSRVIWHKVTEWKSYFTVDMTGAIPYYEDAANTLPWTNRLLGDQNKPIIFEKPTTDYAHIYDDVLKKFREGYQQVRFEQNSYTAGPTAEITGIGILTQIQGVDANVVNSYYEDYRKWLVMPYSFLHSSSFKNLPYKTRYVKSINNGVKYNSVGQPYYLDGGFPTYAEKDMDAGLKRAIANIGTRATFYYAEDTVVPYFVGIDAPIRVLYSILLYQKSYISYLKDLVLNSLSLETIWSMCNKFIDKNVQKPCGIYNDTWSYDTLDSNNPVYNYWIHYIASNVYNTAARNNLKNSLLSEFNKKEQLFLHAENVLKQFVNKIAIDYTYQNVKDAYMILNSLQSDLSSSYIENFVIGYLNILYEYRKFFVTKRFNKQNGTMWIMRQLESVLNLMCPSEQESPPVYADALINSKSPLYKVAFSEINNKTSEKIASFVDASILEEDRVSVVYIKIDWVTKAVYDKWIAYSKDGSLNEVPEIIEVNVNSILRYAAKPVNGYYNLLSDELLEADKNTMWNNLNPNVDQRIVQDIDKPCWYIEWLNGVKKDPVSITLNIFVNIDPSIALEYQLGSITPEEFICLAEKGADFWRVRVPQDIMPRISGFKTNLKLKYYNPEELNDKELNKTVTTINGISSYQLWPIAEAQRRSIPSINVQIQQIGNELNKQITFT